MILIIVRNIIILIFRKLAQNAVHCAFSGFTNFTSGFIDNKPVMIPVDYISELGMRMIDIELDMDYLALLQSTGQASFRENKYYVIDKK